MPVVQLERPEIAPDYDFLVNGRMPHPPLYVLFLTRPASLVAHVPSLFQ